MPLPPDTPLAELLAALSLAADLGNDFPPEKTLRTCVLATALAREHGMSDADVGVVYYATLLRFVGCTGCAVDLARLFGDDNRLRGVMAGADIEHAGDRFRALRQVLDGRGILGGTKIAAAAMLEGDEVRERGATADCEVSARVAVRLGLDPGVPAALSHAFARWDGRGIPRGLAGDGIDRRARVLHVASLAEIRHGLGGRTAALTAVARGAGAWFDPDVATTFAKTGGDLLAMLEGESAWDAALESEPGSRRWAGPHVVDELALAFAHLVDLKSAYRLGHSEGVARLVERACGALGMTADGVVEARRAALLHDLGMYSVPTGILDKPGKLTESERERVRLHAYHTERVLVRSPLLAGLAPLASMHHERLDGTGYHRGARASIVPMAARVIAAADVFQALTQARPHRPGMARSAAAKELEAQALRDELDRKAVRAVCEAAGASSALGRAASGPQGLSEREVDVLRLLARGHSKKQMAKALSIAPGTVHTHVTHIYEKLGVSSRAAAALFAMERGLIPD